MLINIGLTFITALLFSVVGCSSASSPAKSLTTSITTPSLLTTGRTFTNRTNTTATIESASTYHIGIYSDSQGTNPITSLNWGNLTQGTSSTQTIYIENLDNQTMAISASITSGTIAGVTFTNNGPINMIPGSSGPSIYQLQLMLSASSGAKLGNFNFSIGLTGAIPVDIPNQVNIVLPPTTIASTQTTTATSTSNIGIFSDASCTNPITSIEWGVLSQGTSVNQTLYIENINNQTMTVTASASANAQNTGITLTNSGPINMVSGSSGPSVYQLEMFLAASRTASIGNLNFIISLGTTSSVNIASKVNIISSSSTIGTSTSTLKLSSINITPPSPASLAGGLTQQFTASGQYSDGTKTDITSQVTWSSSNAISATISSVGLAKGIAMGTVNITATLSGVVSSPITLTVTTPMLSTITVNPISPILGGIGSNQQFTAIGTYTNNSNADITSKVIWSSSNNGCATISPTGLATVIEVGSANITASLSGITSTNISLTVIPATLISITVIPAYPANLAAGFTQQFTATGTYSDNSTAYITSQVIWSSSNPSNLTISPSGLTEGIAIGNVNIMATLSGVTSSPVTLTVVGPALSSILVTSSSPTNLVVGSTQQFSATEIFSDGSTSDVTNAVNWSSSDNTIAIIAQTGVATGIGVGKTNITATLSGLTSQLVGLPVTSQ